MLYTLSGILIWPTAGSSPPPVSPCMFRIRFTQVSGSNLAPVGGSWHQLPPFAPPPVAMLMDVTQWRKLVTSDWDFWPTGQWLFYTPLVWGETASFGGDIGGLGAVPPAGPGAEPLVRGSGGEAPRSWKLFVSQFFSEARAEIKRFDRFRRMMAQNARNHARMCLFGVTIFNMVLATGRQTTIKIIKIKQQFYC